MTASSTCAVQMLLVALSRRMCCSRVCRARRWAGFPAASIEVPTRAPGRRGGGARGAAGRLACELLAHREEPGVRPAEAQRHPEALGGPDGDVGPLLPGRG